MIIFELYKTPANTDNKVHLFVTLFAISSCCLKHDQQPYTATAPLFPIKLSVS
jgi:hypothetical protein